MTLKVEALGLGGVSLEIGQAKIQTLAGVTAELGLKLRPV